MKKEFNFEYLNPLNINKDWEDRRLELLEEFKSYSLGSKFSMNFNLLHNFRDYPENITVEFYVDQIGDNNLFVSLLEDKPKLIKKLFSEVNYEGGLFYKIFSDSYYEELKKISNEFSKVLICSSNPEDILPKTYGGIKRSFSNLVILILNDGFIILAIKYQESVSVIDSRFHCSFTPSFSGFSNYSKLTDFIRKYQHQGYGTSSFLELSLQLFLGNVFNKIKPILFDRFCKFKEEGTLLLDVFENIEKDIKKRFLKVEGISDEIETDLMNSLTNIKKIKNEVLKNLNLYDINDYYTASTEIINNKKLINYNNKIHFHKELLQNFDFYLGSDELGYDTYNPIFIDFYTKLVPFFESHFSKTFELIELYSSHLSIIISLFGRLENGLSSREYKLLKSEIQESGIFLNVFETLNIEKLDNINLSLEKLISLTGKLGLEMINQLSGINSTLNQINENITQLVIDSNDNLQNINYNVKINNLYSLIGFFQNKRINKVLSETNNNL
jgi:hypothetical protein